MRVTKIECGGIAGSFCQARSDPAPRVIVEAAEAYSDLILDNFATFKGIVDALILCFSYENLEVVKITFNFWFIVAEELCLPERQGQKVMVCVSSTHVCGIVGRDVLLVD